ncbi:hypothetical protein A6J40_06260 [Legionella longbeachae]|uniref:Uncharacterized protein n=2 Tax=Legionella longbeachae TaxID=450 RepID=D3HR35_LEGLN|nr:hypothetical protein A6J40_06260 [Legionella longbeachae]EEZ95532.1 conserved hypothetical protein [Legionella longbeachae D-4968]CBJ11362.1 hypothetical protein LLO_1010 [Legionella longbeachae NSW150]VEE01872.1 Uncharacterised protein [Legionella oakridgensis]HBD7396876.1 hypothetical protein [Legionella pneumophila]
MISLPEKYGAIMKKLVLLFIVLLPFNVLANDEVNPNSYFNNNCENLKDPDERKDCLNIEKGNQAEQNFRNFEQDNQMPYQQDF